MNNLLSLFDYTGNWSRPYREAGWEVTQIDILLGQDILQWDYQQFDRLHFSGILAAVPCTAYALSGARWWPQKDSDGTTDYFDAITRRTLEIIDYFRPGLKFWVIENPIGRIASRVPELKKYRLLTFNPCEFGDPYTKKTVLYGEFRPWLTRRPVMPTEGSKMHKIPPGPNRASLRSETPMGFAYSFFNANI